MTTGAAQADVTASVTPDARRVEVVPGSGALDGGTGGEYGLVGEPGAGDLHSHRKPAVVEPGGDVRDRVAGHVERVGETPADERIHRLACASVGPSVFSSSAFTVGGTASVGATSRSCSVAYERPEVLGGPRPVDGVEVVARGPPRLLALGDPVERGEVLLPLGGTSLAVDRRHREAVLSEHLRRDALSEHRQEGRLLEQP